MEKLNLLDGTGSPVITGNTYAYSNRSNGSVTIIIGTASHVTQKGKLTLNVVKRGSAIYDQAIENVDMFAKIATVSANSIFPIDLKDISW